MNRARLNGKLLALATIISSLCSNFAFGQTAATSGVRLDISSLASQKYSEKSSRDSDGESSEVTNIAASGIQTLLTVAVGKYDMAFQYRSISPEGLQYLSKRVEMTTSVTYHYPARPWTSLIFGFYRWSQTGSTNTEDAPAAFVDANTALVFGLGLEPTIYRYSPAHSVFAYAKSSFLTSLEKDRNYGTEHQVGAGYRLQEGKGSVGLYFGYVQESMQAERLEKELTTLMRSDSIYAGYMIGLQLSYR
jgi:hypothetical protein